MRVVLAQLITTLLLAAIAISHSLAAAEAVLAGGLISVIANGYLALKAFSRSGASAAKAIVQDFYKGEAGKIVITALGFILVLKGMPGLPVAFVMIGFVSALAVHWAAPWLMVKSTTTPK
ncbi:MAG TPA: ATP synthase subunit I [Pseudomonadales bacterium]|nr:ATP synthase subunit I [Pseudomonadales bacterium]